MVKYQLTSSIEICTSNPGDTEDTCSYHSNIYPHSLRAMRAHHATVYVTSKAREAYSRQNMWCIVATVDGANIISTKIVFSIFFNLFCQLALVLFSFYKIRFHDLELFKTPYLRLKSHKHCICGVVCTKCLIYSRLDTKIPIIVISYYSNTNFPVIPPVFN